MINRGKKGKKNTSEGEHSFNDSWLGCFEILLAMNELQLKLRRRASLNAERGEMSFSAEGGVMKVIRYK